MQGGGDFSLEAIGELLSKSEERYADTVMILAGYGDKMAKLLECNPGLCSRFPNHYTFDDYEPLELLEIAKRKAADSSMVLAEDALALLQSTLLATPLPGNGRDVRNLLEGAKKERDTRVVAENFDPVTGVLTMASQEDLATLIAADFTLAAAPLAATATPALAATLDGVPRRLVRAVQRRGAHRLLEVDPVDLSEADVRRVLEHGLGIGDSSAAPTDGDAIEARALPQPSYSTPMAVGNPKPRTSETPHGSLLLARGRPSSTRSSRRLGGSTSVGSRARSSAVRARGSSSALPPARRPRG